MSRRAVLVAASLAAAGVTAGVLATRPRPAPPPGPSTAVDWERELWDRAPSTAAPAASPLIAPPAQVLPRPARAPQQLLTVRNTVADPPAVAREIVAWVAGRGGLAVATKGHHVAVKLPSAELPELFAKFPSLRPSGPAPRVEGAGRLWINLSIELLEPDRR